MEISTGFRRSGEIVLARSSLVSSSMVMFFVSLDFAMAERRASIISDVLSMDRPRAWRSLSSASSIDGAEVEDASCSASKEIMFRICRFILRSEISLSSDEVGGGGDSSRSSTSAGFSSCGENN